MIWHCVPNAGSCFRSDRVTSQITVAEFETWCNTALGGGRRRGSTHVDIPLFLPPAHLLEEHPKEWEAFKTLDTNRNGKLDANELKSLNEVLNVKANAKTVIGALTKSGTGGLSWDGDDEKGVTFVTFIEWLSTKRELDRRQARGHIKNLFKYYDTDGSGALAKDELAKLVKKAREKLNIDFDEKDWENDWEMMHKTLHDKVVFASFENWWKERLGIVKASIPVLPESMVNRIVACNPPAVGKPMRDGKSLWGILRPRVKMLVQMTTAWGNLQDLYSSTTHKQAQNVL